MESKKIIVKEFDRLHSKTFKGKFISEYIIYLMDNDIKLETYTEIGDKAKKERVDMIVASLSNKEDYKYIVEEITNN
jgi:hypothetical protein